MKFGNILKSVGLILVGASLTIAAVYTFRVVCKNQYDLIDNAAACGQKAIIDKTGYIHTQQEIVQFIKESKATGKVSKVSVYFRDLKGGPVFGVNELDDFVPASLLKLPVALAYLSEAERNPDILTVELTYEGSQEGPDFQQTYIPSKTLEIGHRYTIEELLKYMLEFSDNHAFDLLEKYQRTERPGNLETTFAELGITVSDDPYAEILSVRKYASLFRILYNVSYLNPKLSNVTLGWLSKSDFDKGLVDGVPSKLTVAHKFGERRLEEGGDQLHDCGIVYYPGNPYLICVMTQGQNFDDLTKVISAISKTVYNEVESRRL